MSIFQWILAACLVVIGASLLSGLALILRTHDVLTRSVLSDLVFYSMVAFFLIFTLTHTTSIGYEVAVLTGLAAGVLPTLSVSRIITRGRR